MSDLHEDYIKHSIMGRTYTLADGNHICVNIVTDQTELPNGYMRPTESKIVWFMEIQNDVVVFTGKKFDENDIIEQDISNFPNSLVEDIEEKYDVEVTTNISEKDIDIPEKTLNINITDDELKEMSEIELTDYFNNLNDIHPEKGMNRLNKFNNDSFGYTLEDIETGRMMSISKYKQSFKIKLFDNNKNKINNGDYNKYSPNNVRGVIDDFKTFIQIE